MDKIVIEGGRPLEGTVKISGAKNAVLPVLAATLLTRGRNIIEGVPKVRDVATMIQLLKDLGAEVESYRNEKIVLDTAAQYNIPSGIHVVHRDKSELINKINDGFRIIAYGVDQLFLAKSGKDALQDIKGQL